VNSSEISYQTELDREYAEELNNITNEEEFRIFLKKWSYWLEDDDLPPTSWKTIKPIMNECRKPVGITLTARHDTALAVMMPRRLFEVSLRAARFHVPWGTAYIRMKEESIINY
tara:strand:- start:2225 stop:2566 length:342 start_codon:yes stop_codon:yes gene_type:complete